MLNISTNTIYHALNQLTIITKDHSTSTNQVIGGNHVILLNLHMPKNQFQNILASSIFSLVVW